MTQPILEVSALRRLIVELNLNLASAIELNERYSSITQQHARQYQEMSDYTEAQIDQAHELITRTTALLDASAHQYHEPKSAA